MNTMLQPAEAFNPVARSKVLNIEAEIAKLPQHEFKLRHYFVDGLYVREIEIPAGCILVGYIHTQPCITTVAKGTIALSDGENVTEVSAPYTTTVAPGTKKVGYALTDVIWLDAYVNTSNEHDIKKLEERLTANTHEEYLLKTEKVLQLEYNKS